MNRHIHAILPLLALQSGAFACSSGSSNSSNDAGISATMTGSSSGAGTSGTTSGSTGASSSGTTGSSSSSSGTTGGSDASSTPLGPGAAYMCASSGKDAWDTYGAAAFVAVNKSIFANVTAQLADAGTSNLGDAFTKIGGGAPPSTTDDLATFEGKLAAFLVYAYGGPTSIVYSDGKTYDGVQDMTAAHAGLNITMDQYNYFIANVVVPALTGNGVPSGDVSSCFAPVVTDPTFVASIVGH